MALVLASASERRQALLAQFGFNFSVAVADVAEVSNGNVDKVAIDNAFAKAEAVLSDSPGKLVIGADTIVIIDDQILGKPDDAKQARAMLQALSGRTHQVITGVALCTSSVKKSFAETTRVSMRKICDYEIEAYLKTGEPFDKAGSYGIQGIGGAFVESIAGCYYNVVGLPMPRLILELRKFGFDIFAQGKI